MPQLQYEYLGFPSQKEYDKFCRHIVELYESNDQVSTYGIADRIARRNDFYRREFSLGVDTVNYQQIIKILHKYDADVRSPFGRGRRVKRVHKNITLEPEDCNFLDNINDMYDQYHMRREFLDFLFAIVRGTPTPHMIFWMDEFKPVLVLYDFRTSYYTMISEHLSKLEARTMEPIMGQVEKDLNLDALKAFCNEHGLTWWGDND